jgi:large subunit ribosomal protein L18
MKNKREQSRLKRHNRIRMRVIGTSDRPRLVIRRSLKHLHAQVIDDAENKVLFSASTFDKQIKGACVTAGNIKAAVMLGEIFAKKAYEKGISSIVFDRAGYLYHGRVKAFADSLRKGGLNF